MCSDSVSLMSEDQLLVELPLRQLFQQAQDIYNTLEASQCSLPVFTQQLLRGTALLQQAATVADRAGIFSRNDELDDIPTADLKYILIPYLHAQLLCLTPSQSQQIRTVAIKQAVELFAAFLEQALHFEIYEDVHRSNTFLKLDSGTNRLQKIERFKKDKALREKIVALQKNCDDESERELRLAELNLAVCTTVDKLPSIHCELEILAHAASLPEAERETAPTQPNPELLQSLAAAANALQINSSKHSREYIKSQIFKPSYKLPTMSIEQAGMKELAQAHEQRKRADSAGEKEERRYSNLTEEEKDDENVAKQRRWDEFKDDNPRGWGNSKLRPCG